MTNSCAPPDKEDISYSGFVTGLVGAQWHAQHSPLWLPCVFLR
jgi:hypothetical protein